MITIILWVAFLVANAAALFYMLKVRRAGAQDPILADGLTGGERILAILVMFFGGIIIAGSILYYGWKKRFPLKARSVLHIEWVLIILFAVVIATGAYWQYSQYNKNVSDFVTQLDEQQKQTEQTQESALTSSPPQRYQGIGYSINIPSGWVENKPLDSSGNDYFIKNWTVPTASQQLSVSWTNSRRPDSTPWYTEAVTLEDAASSPDKFTLTHPSIAGASKTNMIVGQVGDYVEVALFAHGAGRNLYYIKGTLLRATPAQVEALKQILLSFALRS